MNSTDSLAPVNDDGTPDWIQILSPASVVGYVAQRPSGDDLQLNGQALSNLGFTHILRNDKDTAVTVTGLPLLTNSPPNTSLVDCDAWVRGTQSGESLWSNLENTIGFTWNSVPMVGGAHGCGVVLQAAVPHIPILAIDDQFIPGTSVPESREARDTRELVRSAFFWRSKFAIPNYSSTLLHAGSDGSLLFTTHAWLIALNPGTTDLEVDLSHQGNFWLMLGTSVDVHLYGSLLQIPSGGGAILANEALR